MAKRTRKTNGTKVKGFQGSSKRGPSRRKNFNTTIFLIGFGVIIVGLIAYGMLPSLGGSDQAVTEHTALAAGEGGLQSTSIEEGAQQVSVAQPVDRESQFLGPESDAETLQLAEAGQVGKPTLVWFHADW